LSDVRDAVNVLNSRKSTKNREGTRFVFEFIKEPDLEGEVWKDIVPEEWQEGGRYYGI